MIIFIIIILLIILIVILRFEFREYFCEDINQNECNNTRGCAWNETNNECESANTWRHEYSFPDIFGPRHREEEELIQSHHRTGLATNIHRSGNATTDLQSKRNSSTRKR